MLHRGHEPVRALSSSRHIQATCTVAQLLQQHGEGQYHHLLCRTGGATFCVQVRQELGLPADARLAVLIHGGHKAELPVREDFLPPGWVCVACNGGRPLSPTPLPANFRLAPADVYTPDLVAACDCVIGKIGYG